MVLICENEPVIVTKTTKSIWKTKLELEVNCKEKPVKSMKSVKNAQTYNIMTYYKNIYPFNIIPCATIIRISLRDTVKTVNLTKTLMQKEEQV